ncbi:Rrf2 family transcriptional regulator [Priestia taiwanensis]|uniref:Rrf2 family transcriptional regulator n=1 Tax=Priestia taiwanensis TaxID=1347902 RepID=A0A917AVU2_9BACI|nr:Rrf2 family transcriptional regulator [Priestia taiwanensis]MBM7364766.1 Rrf2 family protein [Priestia taiwanensis]GGE79448.1 Rrf2 family transcriptional regulator [Priestia taiwanensis]
MKYSKATNYALHTIAYLALVPTGKTIGVKQLANVQKVSPTYLSKVLTTLVKATFIESVPGVNGGYRLVKEAKDITFLDVIHAIEGKTPLFHCEVESTMHDRQTCFIESIMSKAEQKTENYLRSQTIENVVQKMKAHIKECAHSATM